MTDEYTKTDTGEPLTPLFAPLDESERKGRRYAVAFRTELGIYGVNWWPVSCRPEDALQAFGLQLMLLPDALRLDVMNQCASAVARTMYGALCREADAMPLPALNKPPSPRG